MKWSWKIATISGIGVYLHVTFLILVAYFVLNTRSGGGGLLDMLGTLLLLAAIFSIVVMHEFGHALAARRYGIRTQDITLLPIGGVARLERIPEDPKQELVVAVAGPAVNVVLAALCLLILLIAGTAFLTGVVSGGFERMVNSLSRIPRIRSVADLPDATLFLVWQMLLVNMMMILFNLLPAFPMDGGRVLRALLAMWTDRVRATQIAAQVGQAMAVLFAIIGLFGIPGWMPSNPFLMFIALFVWLSAGAEAAQVASQSAMGGTTVRNAMITRFQTVSPEHTLENVSAHIISGYQQDFPVVDGSDVVGMLTRKDLLKALAQHSRDTRVSEVMQRDFQRAESAEQLTRVFERLQHCQCRSMPVLEQGRLVGVIDMENVGEFIALRSAMRDGLRA